MAGRGPAPKNPEQRRRRNADPVAQTSLVDDGELCGPELSELTGRDSWPPHVLSWFADWRASAQAKSFLRTDWRRLAMVAYLVEEFPISEKPGPLLAEIRLNEERLGATIADRQRLRMRITPAEPEDESSTSSDVVSIRDRIAARRAEASSE